VIARLTIDFRTELNYGDQLRIGTRLLKLRRTSAVLGHGLFRRETCAATAEIDSEFKHEADCKAKIGSALKKVCSKSGMAPHATVAK